MRSSQGFGGTGERSIYFRGTEDKRSNFEENSRTKTILGNRNIRKQLFDFWETGEQTNSFQRNKGTGTPWEGLRNCQMVIPLKHHKSNVLQVILHEIPTMLDQLYVLLIQVILQFLVLGQNDTVR